MNEQNVKNVENVCNIFETTKITDLNTDCMEAIFEYLEFNDLLHVAESNKLFQTAVCRVFQRNYAKKALIYDQVAIRRQYDRYFIKLYMLSNANDWIKFVLNLCSYFQSTYLWKRRYNN